MPSFSMAAASARMPRPEAFSERKSSSMITRGKRNFMGRFQRAPIEPARVSGLRTGRAARVSLHGPNQKRGRIMGRFGGDGYGKTEPEPALSQRRDNRLAGTAPTFGERLATPLGLGR